MLWQLAVRCHCVNPLRHLAWSLGTGDGFSLPQSWKWAQPSSAMHVVVMPIISFPCLRTSLVPEFLTPCRMPVQLGKHSANSIATQMSRGTVPISTQSFTPLLGLTSTSYGWSHIASRVGDEFRPFCGHWGPGHPKTTVGNNKHGSFITVMASISISMVAKVSVPTFF